MFKVMTSWEKLSLFARICTTSGYLQKGMSKAGCICVAYTTPPSRALVHHAMLGRILHVSWWVAGYSMGQRAAWVVILDFFFYVFSNVSLTNKILKWLNKWVWPSVWSWYQRSLKYSKINITFRQPHSFFTPRSTFWEGPLSRSMPDCCRSHSGIGEGWQHHTNHYIFHSGIMYIWPWDLHLFLWQMTLTLHSPCIWMPNMLDVCVTAQFVCVMYIKLSGSI